jgi:type IV pilus assembly protein PilY1
VTVPQGAIITTANLTFRAQYTQANPIGNGTIRGQYSDNTLTFNQADTSDYDSRPRTTNSAWWKPSGWTADTDYTSPEIKSIVQEIVNRPGWASGNAMAFFIEHNLSVYTAAYSYDTGSAYAPKLHIEYT